MQSKVKAHRRNNAVQAFQDNRMSVPSNFIYNSQTYQKPINVNDMYRASDMCFIQQTYKVNNQSTPNKQKLVKFQMQDVPKRKQQQNNILNMFKNLQMKLESAKKQLVVKNTHKYGDSNYQLNSYQNSVQKSCNQSQRNKLFQLQQSTINFQSHKGLMNMMKSKERLILANKIKTYYVSQVVKGTVGLNQRAIQHIAMSLQILKSCQGLNLPNQIIKKNKNLDLSRLNPSSSKKILVLDLDQTLFHCFQQRNYQNDLQIIADLDNNLQKLYISIRPYAISFLKRMNKYYDIVAFTASQRCYADAVLNELDPNYQLIKARLYRQHCIKLNDNIYSKDLRLITNDLSKIVLVDNSIFSCLYQLENSIPIIPYYGGEDSQFLVLEKYLEQLCKQKDVRVMNGKTFRLRDYGRYEDYQTLIRQLYCNVL